jgi:O-succinylbenzoic acid--CoA ligase
MDASSDFTGSFNPSLRVILLGGAPADAGLLSEAAMRGLPVLTSYGMTETCSQIAAMRPSDPLDKLGSAGRPLNGVCVDIMKTHESVPCESGRIRVSGPMVSQGYLLSGNESGDTPFNGGWFLTSDIGRMDEDGYLWIERRIDDVIISGGENVFPADVEAVLRSHPAVSDAAVFGIPDKNWGEAVCCLVVLKGNDCVDKAGDSNTLQIEEIRNFCKSHLAPHQVPKRYAIVDALPLNGAGKRNVELMRIIVTGNR